MGKLTFLFLLLSFPARAEAQVRNPDSFVHVTSRLWHTLDPAFAYDAVSFILAGNVYEPLIVFKSLRETESFEPFLASQVPTLENGLLSPDRLTYTFPMRRGVVFHDGTPLTVEDVRYSILRFMLLDVEGGPSSLLLQPILGVYGTRDSRGEISLDFKEAERAVQVREESVVIRLKKPDSTFLKVLASLPLVMSKKWSAAHGGWDGSEGSWKHMNNRAAPYLQENMNGTGPFKLEKVDMENDQAVLSRHDGYWRKPAPLKRVFFKAVPNGALRLFMLETGDADAGYLENSYRSYAPMMQGIRWIEDLPAYDIGDVIFFNFGVHPADNDFLGSGELDGRGIPSDFFSDPEVRRGMAYAFDYEKYLKLGLGMRGHRASGPFPPDLLPEAAGKPFYAYDPARAEEAFKKAFGGKLWKNGFVLPVAYSADNVSRQAAAEILQEGLQKLNSRFKVRLLPMPSQQISQEIESRRLPLYVAGYYADYPDAHTFAFGLLHSQGYYPRYQGYSNSKADALVERAASLAGLQERRKVYLELSQIALQDVPQIYAGSPLPFKAHKDWVLGFDSQENVNNLNFNNFPYFYSYSKKSSP